MTRAAVYVEPNAPLSIEEFEPTPPGSKDVVVSLLASGVCHSDLSVAHGDYGDFFPKNTILGHEGAGVVVEVGSEVVGITIGDTVVGSAIPSCGICWFCLHDLSYLCDLTGPGTMIKRGIRSNGDDVTGMTGLGTFAETMTCSQSSVVRVETDLPSEQLALIGCAVSTGVGAALFTAGVAPGESVAVIGCGGVGLSVVQGAQVAGASRIIAIDPVAQKRDMAMSLGATEALDPNEGDLVKRVRELTQRRGVDYSFEVVGRSSTIVQACEMIRKGGTAVIVGSVPAGSELRFPRFLDFRTQSKTLKCSVYGATRSRRDFQKIIDLVEIGRLKLDHMVSRIIKLDEVNDALTAIESDGAVIRSVITSY